VLCTTASLAQNISIKLADANRALVHIDSADWSDAWIELDGEIPGKHALTKDDLVITEGDQKATVLSIDSIRAQYSSHLALSFVLDNSGSMFHAYDSLTRMCDTLVSHLPPGAIYQAAVFDGAIRSDMHLHTLRSNVFIALSAFLDTVRALSAFWHNYDSIRTSYTPLFDATAAAIQTIIDRRERDSVQRRDVVLLVTDGKDNASRTSIEELEALCSSTKIKLFAINFRTEPDHRIVWLTNRLKSEYFYAEDISSLRETLATLDRSVARQYHVRYRFPFIGPSGTR